MPRKATQPSKPRKGKGKLSRGNARGGNRPQVAADILAAEERQRKAVALRKSATPWDDIAKALGVTRSTVFRDVEKYRLQINEECCEGADEMRRQEDERLDASAFRINGLLNPSEKTRMAEAYKPLTVTERVKCEEALGKIGDRRAKLWGYAAPDKQEIDDGRKTREQQMAEVAQGTGLSVDDIAAVFGEAKG